MLLKVIPLTEVTALQLPIHALGIIDCCSYTTLYYFAYDNIVQLGQDQFKSWPKAEHYIYCGTHPNTANYMKGSTGIRG